MKSKKKSVWLINQYLTTPELDGNGHRHYYLASEWEKKGYDVTLITSSFSHIGNRKNSFSGLFKITNENIRTLLIKGNTYKNSNGPLRILSWLIFSFLLFFIPTKKLPKPDIIIVSSISLLPILNVKYYFLKKFKNCKFILEIRDIWPLSIIEIGNYSSKSIFIKFLSWVEKTGYQSANHIVSLLVNTDEHIKTILGHSSFNYTWISNGYNLENNSYYKSIPEELKEKIPSKKFVIGYTGALGKANSMETVVDVVRQLEKEDIALCIVGEGYEKENLKNRAKGAKNIYFFDVIEKCQIQSFLKECDLLFFSSKNLDIYRFGISANKTFDYMYAAKPIILTAPTMNNAIQLGDCGSVISAEDFEALKEEILKYAKMSHSEMQVIGTRGKEYLLNNLTYSHLASKYENVFKTL